MSNETIAADVFFVDRKRDQPLQAQLREIIVSSIVGGRFPKGARMPSTRKLASHLGISRITISLAYQELVSQGYLVSAERSSYAVSQSAPIPLLNVEPSARDERSSEWYGKVDSELLDRRRVEKPSDWRHYPYPFVYGQMDMSLFDHAAWRDCSRRALSKRDFAETAGDIEAGDDPMLVDYICSHTLPRRGVTATPDEVLVTLGAQNALWIVVQLLARMGLHAAIENPGYPDVATALRWNGAHVTPIGVDADGLPPDKLPEGVGAVFVTPSHQSPTAVTMSMGRRRRLLAGASERDYVIVEDDYEFEMSFLAPPSPALKSLDQDGRVLYIGSFSKAIFPGLRLGYLVAPNAFIREARQLRSLMLRHAPGHQQRTVAYFLSLGFYEALIRKMRLAFSERRQVLEAALQGHGIEIAGAAKFGGTNFWVRGPEGTDSSELAATLLRQGVLIEAGTPFFDAPTGPVPYFRAAYSSIPTDRIEAGVSIIAREINGKS